MVVFIGRINQRLIYITNGKYGLGGHVVLVRVKYHHGGRSLSVRLFGDIVNLVSLVFEFAPHQYIVGVDL